MAETEFFLGLVWKDLGDQDKSIEHYERSVQLDPRSQDGKCESNLAIGLAQKGMRDEARRRYEHCLLVNPKLQVAHKELADILCGNGEIESAIAHYEAALRIQPDFKQAKTNLDFARTLVKR